MQKPKQSARKTPRVSGTPGSAPASVISSPAKGFWAALALEAGVSPAVVRKFAMR